MSSLQRGESGGIDTDRGPQAGTAMRGTAQKIATSSGVHDPDPLPVSRPCSPSRAHQKFAPAQG